MTKLVQRGAFAVNALCPDAGFCVLCESAQTARTMQTGADSSRQQQRIAELLLLHDAAQLCCSWL